MEFDVGSWESSKKTDNLNKKLFGGTDPQQILQKLSQKGKDESKQQAEVKPSSAKKKKRKKKNKAEKKDTEPKSAVEENDGKQRNKYKDWKGKDKVKIGKKRKSSGNEQLDNLSPKKQKLDELKSSQNNTNNLLVNSDVKSKKKKKKKQNASPDNQARVNKENDDNMTSSPREKGENMKKKKGKVNRENAKKSNNSIDKLNFVTKADGIVNKNQKRKKKKKCKNKYKDLHEKQIIEKAAVLGVDPETLTSKKSPGKVTQSETNTPKSAKKRKRKSIDIESNLNGEDISNAKQKKMKTAKERYSKKSAKAETTSPVKSPFNIDKIKSLLSESSKKDAVKSEADSGTKKSPKAKANDEPQTLRERMEEKLNAARFRFLNEQLYTSHSKAAYKLMSKDLSSFKVYHQGFSSQVNKWPQNPVNKVIDYVKKQAKSHIVADFGCGDAKLAASVSHKVHSFDLVALNDRVTACDMSKVPLANSSVDIGVFCLSLMGTNLVDFIKEANRVLKKGCTLIVVEVVSRFEKVNKFAKQMEKLGFSLDKQDATNKMFVWMEFKKTGKLHQNLPEIELGPCIYKKR